MKNGFKLLWSDRALGDLQAIINYLSEKWTTREIQNFARKLDKRIELILSNPRLFPKTAKRKNIYRSVLTKHTVIYYEMSEKSITIVTLFDSRQNPRRLKL